MTTTPEPPETHVYQSDGACPCGHSWWLHHGDEAGGCIECRCPRVLGGAR